MKHFVLVHGFGHGAWCWYKLVPLLKRAGHRVTAVDLNGAMREIRTFDDYVEPLMALMRSIDPHDEVILVGHSFGGMVISLAMEKFPEKILVAVFVSANMPNCTSPPATLLQETFKITPNFLDTTFEYNNGLESAPTSAILGPVMLATKFYQNCKPEDVELGKMLVKADRFFREDLEKEGMFSKDRYGAVNRVFVVCEQDEFMKKTFQQWMIETSPPQEVKFIPNADHMPMLSSPQELCLCLLEIAKKYQPIRQ